MHFVSLVWFAWLAGTVAMYWIVPHTWRDIWLIVVSLGLLIPIFGIVFGTTTNYLARVRQAELEASLKHNMLEQGMTAE